MSLPPFLLLELNLSGETCDIFDRLYAIFKNDLIDNNTYYRKLLLDFDKRKIILRSKFNASVLIKLIHSGVIKEDNKENDYVYWNLAEEQALTEELKKLSINSSPIIALFKEFNKEKIFWHLIEKNCFDSGRVIEFPSAQKIHWLKPVIVNDPHEKIINFDYLEGSGKVRTYLWLKEFQYVVILELRDRYKKVVLITAFHVSGGKEKDLESKYRRRVHK